MIRSHLLIASLGLTILLTTAGASHAQHGHGGGGHGGAAHVGAVNHGAAYYHNGYYNHGYYPYGRGPFIGIGIGGYGYGYGYGSPYYAPYYPALAYGGPGYAYPPTTVIMQGQQQPATVAPVPDGPPATTPNSPDAPPPPKNAQVKVVLPDADAKVWFDNNPTKATGSERLFHTPDLTPGANNSYRIRAAWIVNGKEMVQEFVVPVLAGRMSVVDFSRPASESVAPPPAAK